MSYGNGCEYDFRTAAGAYACNYGDFLEFRRRLHDVLGTGSLASASMEVRLTKTVRMLPPEVGKFIRERCRFLEVSPDGKQTFVARRGDEHDRLILLTSGADEATIAHEIAHAWLGHPWPPSPDTLENAILQKIAARTTVKKWGWSVQAHIDYYEWLLDGCPMRRAIPHSY